MLHRDEQRVTASATYAQELEQALSWLLAGISDTSVLFRKDCGWNVSGLIAAALVWAWSSERTLRDRLEQSLEVSAATGYGKAPSQTSYNAFLKLLVRWTDVLRSLLVQTLRGRMEQGFSDMFRIAGFFVLAVDGTKIGLPRTESNESRFSPRGTRKRQKKQNGRGRRKTQQMLKRRAIRKKADSPQCALTMLYHLGTRLPWNWQHGASHVNERAQLRQMKADLPADSLLVMDGGFVGYDFWRELLTDNLPFVVRVGGNIRLLKKLGFVRESHQTIYLWPDKNAKRKQPPLVLRLVVVHGARHPWYLVTSVRDPKRLSDSQIADLYRRRWGIEVFFRHFKQTFQRGKLRSHKAEHAQCELEWSLLGLWTMQLYAQHQLQEAGVTGTLSIAKMLRGFAEAITHAVDGTLPQQSLVQRLQAAVIDRYRRRDKRSRGYPRKKYEPRSKPPQIFYATKAQQRLAQNIPVNAKQKGLTA